MSDLTKANIEQLVEARLSEAISLFEEGHFSGAYYLGGYAIELAIKACIANVFQKGTIPDRKFVNSVYDHNLTALINASRALKRSERPRRKRMLILPRIGSMLRPGLKACVTS